MRSLARIFLPLALALSLCSSAAAQNTSAQESRKAQLEKEIAQIQKQLKDNSSKSRSALG